MLGIWWSMEKDQRCLVSWTTQRLLTVTAGRGRPRGWEDVDFTTWVDKWVCDKKQSIFETMSHTCTSLLRYLVMVENPKKPKNVAKRTMNKKLRHTPIKFMTSFQFLEIRNWVYECHACGLLGLNQLDDKSKEYLYWTSPNLAGAVSIC